MLETLNVIKNKLEVLSPKLFDEETQQKLLYKLNLLRETI